VTISEQPAPSYDDVVSSHLGSLLRLALMLTGSIPDAEDLVQSALLKATKHAERIKVMEAPLAYLRRVVINEHTSAMRVLRRRVTTVSAGLDAPDPAAETGMHHLDARDEMWRVLSTLPRTQRTVLVLRFYEDLDDAEISNLLRCSQSTVRSNAARAIGALREQFGKDLR